MTKKLFFFFVLLMALQANAQEIRYVTPAGSGTMDGSSWNNASNDIQLMMDALTSGGEVWVAAGTYEPLYNISSGAYYPGSRENSFALRNNVKLCGGFNGTETSLAQRDLFDPANETILNGDLSNNDTTELNYDNLADNVLHVVIAVGLSNAQMDGLTIKGGYASFYGYHEVSGFGLSGIYGGALFVNNSSITLKNVNFKQNRASEFGGAIYGVWATVNATSCSFDRDFIGWGYGGAVFIENSDAPVPGSTFNNCLFTNNLSNSYGAVFGYSDGTGPAPVFNNCTFYNNGGDDQADVISYYSADGGGDMEFNNCIIDRGSGSIVFTVSESILFRHTLTTYAPFFSLEGYGNMFSISPMFTDAANGDYSLQEQSPAVDSGSNSLVPAGISTDLSGNARILGANVDRGAFENLQAVSITPDANGVVYVKPGSTGNNDGSSWANATQDLAKALYTAYNNPQITAIWVAGGTYKPKYRPDNLSPANPDDRYNAFRMVPNVKVYGGFAGTESLLSERQMLPENASILTGDLAGNDIAGFGNRGDNAYHVVIAATGCDMSLLDGFTIIGGNADHSDFDGSFMNYFYIDGQIYSMDSGAGLYSKSLMPIKNILFEENFAIFRGGACNIIVGMDITSCRFIYNVAGKGGGAMCSSGSVNVTNCLFSENRSDNSGGVAYIYVNSTVNFKNCIFRGNKSVLQTGVIAIGSSVLQSGLTFTNCTIAGNGTATASHTLFANFTPEFRNCIISKPLNAAANTRISDNINSNIFKYVLSTYPLGTNPASEAYFETDNIYFSNEAVGDYTLRPYSQALDSGKNAFATGLAKDYAGNDRILYEDVDMGAIENTEQALPTPDYQGIVYVKRGGIGNKKGNSWTNARPELADALLAAKFNLAIHQIWVAGGTYKPLYDPVTNDKSTTARRNTFVMAPNVKLYGGFAGNETSLAQRNLSLEENKSVLSGDLNGDDVPDNFSNHTENAFHVIVVAGELGTAEINGFTVTGGNASGQNYNTYTVYGQPIAEFRGGGFYIVESSPAISDIEITNNRTSSGGGGVFVNNGTPAFKNISVKRNACFSEDGGGAVLINNFAGTSGRSLFQNCLFYKNMNYGFSRGNEIRYASNAAADNAPSFTNCTFIPGYDVANNLLENVPFIFGGDFPKTAEFSNCIIVKPEGGDTSVFSEINGSNSLVFRNSFTNYSWISNDPANTGNVYAADPFFTNPENGDYTLRPYSLAMNIGNNALAAGLETDLAGNPRIQFGTVDPGAFETSKQVIPKPDANGVVYVNKNASGTGEGDSWDNARQDLADALLATQFNPGIQEIWVAGGKYTPQYHPVTFDNDPANRENAFVIKEGVKLYGGFAGNEASPGDRDLSIEENASILSGDLDGNNPDSFDEYGYDFSAQQENAYHVVIAAGAMGDAVLDGFTVTGGHADADAPLALNGESIAGHYGGGLYMAGGEMPVEHVTFLFNAAEEWGGGAYLDGESPYITACLFNYNVAPNGAGLYGSEASPVITNSVFFQNRASVAGGGMYNDGGAPVLTNLTMLRNYAEDGISGALYNAATSASIRNSIIYNNNGGIYDNGNASSVAYSFVQDMPGGDNGNLDGNMYFDDIFPGEYDGDFAAAFSVFAGIGSNDYFAAGQTPDLSGIVTDFAGGQRQYGTVDMGAVESTMLPFPVADENGIVYIKQDGLGNGTSWENAANNIQDAMFAEGVQQIWVAGGTYIPAYSASETLYGEATGIESDRTFLLQPDIKIYGGFAGTETLLAERDLSLLGNASILSGDLNGDDIEGNYESYIENSYHVVIAAGPAGEGMLDGFTITGGCADGNGNLYIDDAQITEDSGGGMYICNSAFALNHIIFRNNYAGLGAGLFTQDSEAQVTNSLFYGNIASYGAALCNWSSSPWITNVTITGNQAGIGAGIYNYISDPAINNTIVYGNTGNGVDNHNSYPLWRSCLIQDFNLDNGWNDAIGVNGGNNQGVYTMYNDPVFAGPENNNYTLHPSSIALNSGDASLYPGAAAAFDLLGNARVFGPIDIGAYELLAITACSAATSWYGSEWTNGAPTSEMYKAEIFADYDSSLHGAITACSLIIHQGDVVISFGDNFIINREISVAETASLTVAHNANLIQLDPSIVNESKITLIKESAPMYRLDYAMWASPVAGQKLKAFSPQTLDNRFYTYNPLSDAYATIVTPATTDFDEGKGYLIRVANNHPAYVSNDIAPTRWTGTFTGVPNNGDIDVPVIPKDESIKGYNSIGNPYPSSINIKAFFEANENNLAEDTPIYFWRKKNDAGTSSYASLTLAGYNANSGNAFGDSSNGVFDDPNDSENWVINPGQGFIVRATGTIVAFNNEMRVAVNNGQMFRSAMEAEGKSRLWLNLTNAEGAFGQTTIAYTPFTTLGRDFGWDGAAITDGDIAIYSLSGENKLGIQARPAFNAADEVPMECKITTAGSYTISLDHFDGVFLEGQEIYLRDNLLGVTHNLQSPYEFTTDAGTITGRFDVVYAEALSTDVPTFNSNSIIVYKQGSSINISTGNADMKSVSVYDIRGRLLYSADNINADATSITTLQAQEQMLIIEVSTNEGVKASRKIVF